MAPLLGDFNSMQAGAGLVFNQGSPAPTAITPGEMSIRLTQQATQQLVQSTQQMAYNSGMVGAQFREQYHAIQQQQSFNPFVAQALSQSSLGGPTYGGMLPSPLMMTPPETGSFRPRAAEPLSPIPPAYASPLVNVPLFTIQQPPPIFQTYAEQQANLADVNATRRYSYAAQAPNLMGQGIGYAGGAMMGASIGSAFGPWGKALGAGIGAVGAGMVGLPDALGGVGDFFMRPSVQRHQLGAAVQNMSQNWVVGGPQLHAGGRGLTRDASIEMGGAIQDLASTNKSLGFNAQDYSQILRGAGTMGMMDMEQSVPQIKQQLQTVAKTVSQFMKLTSDPDVTSVIRQMGQLHAFGLSPQEMEQAAFNMKRFSKAAGTSIEGLQQMGGLPGAMTFQQAGMSAGAGFNYGNAAAASVRQLVASGGVDVNTLSRLGGISGMTQREIQSQAAFNSMPLLTASYAQYGPQGWDVSASRLNQVGQGGAFGMVNNAVAAMSGAVARGGIGALVTYPLEADEMREKAMAAMTPAQMMAQKYNLAMQMGKQFGFKNEQALAFGARNLYGDDVAEQMMLTAKSPQYWKEQKARAQEQLRDLAIGQEKEVMDAGSGWAMRGIKGSALGRRAANEWNIISGAPSAIGTEISTHLSGVKRSLERAGDFIDDYMNAPATGVRTRISGDAASRMLGLSKTDVSKLNFNAGMPAVSGMRYGNGMMMDESAVELQQALNQQNAGSFENWAKVGGISATVAGLGIGGASLGVASLAKGAIGGMGMDALGNALPWLQGSVAGTFMDAESKQRSVRALRDTASQQQNFNRLVGEKGQNKAFVAGAETVLKQVITDGKVGDKLNQAELLSKGSRFFGKEIINSAGPGLLMSDQDRRGALKKFFGQENIPNASGIVDKMSESAVQQAVAAMVGKAEADQPDVARASQEMQTKAATVTRSAVERAVSRTTGMMEAGLEDLEGRISFSDETAALSAELGSEAFVGVALQAGLIANPENAKLKRQEAEFKAQFKRDFKAKNKGASDTAAEQAYGEEYKKYQEKAVALKKTAAGTFEEISGMFGSKFMGWGEADVKTVKQQVDVKNNAAYLNSLNNADFVGRLTKYGVSSKFIEGLESDPDKSPTAIAKRIGPEAIARMEKEGDAADKKLARQLKGAAAGDQKAISEFVKDRAETRGGSREEVAATRTPRGEQADKLRTDVKTFDDLGATFKDFVPAAKDFAKGAADLRAAMESDMMKKALE